MTNSTSPEASPRWNSTTKLVVGLTIVALFLAMLLYFRSIVGPLLLAFIVAYLLHPLTVHLSNLPRLSWRSSVAIIYVVLVIVLAGLSTLTGLATVQQIQSLIRTIQRFLADLPTLLDDLSDTVYMIGPFRIDLGQYLDLNSLSGDLISTLQLLIGRAGSLVSTFATGAANIIGWAFFVLVVSYFILVDAGRVPDAIHYINLPGYDADIRRMGRELGQIWDAFLRGQLLIVGLVMISYLILLTILGVRFTFGLALLAGIAVFIPYVGPAVNWVVLVVVTLLQSDNYFGLDPVVYMILVMACAFILNQIFDGLVSPRIMGDTLGVHPAGVLVVAIIAAQLIGIVGLLLAAPVLATVQLIGRYMLRKMFDLDPWPTPETNKRAMRFPIFNRTFQRLRAWWRSRRSRKG